MSLPRVLVSLHISGSEKFDPSAFSKMVGVDPDKHWRAGDPIHGTKMYRKTSDWILQTDEMESLDCGSAIESLIKRIEPLVAKIARLGEKCQVDEKLIKVVAYVSDRSPSIRVCPHALSVMSQLNISLDIDIILTE